MQVEERLRALLSANPDTLAAIDAALAGKKPEMERPASLRLLRMGDAARENSSDCRASWHAMFRHRPRA
jgi:hypothetical protein